MKLVTIFENIPLIYSIKRAPVLPAAPNIKYYLLKYYLKKSFLIKPFVKLCHIVHLTRLLDKHGRIAFAACCTA